jgi:tetratricopeptide (TPR) repeat protein
MATGRWDEATATFEELVRRGDDPDAWEGLAVAARWRGDLARAVVAREHAYRLFRSAGDDESAARVAALLALDVAESSGASAVAAGWLARARDLLRDRPESTWHAVVEGVEGAVAGVYERDFGRARRLLESAVAASGAGGDLDSELLDNPRTDHASLLTWRGQYVEAEQELRLVLEQARGWSRPVALARLYLAELDRRRGRLDAAYTLWLAAGELFRNAGTPREVAACEREAGWCQHLLGHSEGATKVRSAVLSSPHSGPRVRQPEPTGCSPRSPPGWCCRSAPSSSTWRTSTSGGTDLGAGTQVSGPCTSWRQTRPRAPALP